VVNPDETLARSGTVEPDPGQAPEPASLLTRADAFAFGAVFATVCVAVGFRWYYDNWLSGFDILSAFLPWFGYIGDRVRELEVPAWNRFDSSGYSTVGTPSSGWMYLPVMFAFSLFQVLTAFKVMVLIQALISATAMYLFLRRIGVIPLAALGGATALAIGPALYGSTLLSTVVGQVTPFIAVGLLATEMTLRAQRPDRFLGWAALAGIAVSQIYVAWPGQGFVYGAMYVGGWALYRTFVPAGQQTAARKTRLTRLGLYGALTGIIGFGFAAAAILPQLDFIRQSNIGTSDYDGVPGGDYVAFTWSWARIFTMHLQDVFLSRLDTIGYSLFALAVVAVVCVRTRFGVPFFAIMAFLLTDLSAQPSLTRWLFYLIPPFEDLHSHRPTGSIAFVSPAYAVLAAAAIHVIATEPNRFALRRVIAPLGVLVTISAIALIGGYPLDWWPMVVGAITLLLVALPLLAKRRASTPGFARLSRLAAVGVVLTLLIYPTITDVARSVNDPTGRPKWDNLLTKDASVESVVDRSMSRSDPGGAGEVLKSAQLVESPFRYVSYLGDETPEKDYLPSAERRLDPYVLATLANGRSTRLGLEQISGYNPVHLQYYVEYIAAMNGTEQDYHWLDIFAKGVDGNQLLNMLNARFILIPTNLSAAPPVAAAGKEVFRNEYVIVYKNLAAFERVWIVHDVRPNNDGEGLQQLAAGSVDGHVTAFVDGELPVVAPVAADAPQDWLVFEDRSSEKLRFRMGTSQPGLAVISQPYENGWVAYVDGEKTEILRTNHALMGVPVSAGDHRIELRYEPDSVAWGTGLSLATGTLVLGLWASALVTTAPSRRVARALRIEHGVTTFREIAARSTATTLRRDVVGMSTMLLVTLVAVAFRWYFDNWMNDYDRSTQFIPWYGEIGDRLRQFEIPAWNTHDSGGAPFAGSPANGWMYLPVMIAFTLLPVIAAFKLLALMLSVIGGVSTYLLGRRLGLGALASTTASVTFSIGPLLYGSTMYATPTSQILPFITLGLLAIDLSIIARRRSAMVGWAALLGIAMANMYTATPPRFMYAAMCIAGWYAYRTIVEPPKVDIPLRGRLIRNGISASIAGVIALGFGAAAILPQLAFQSASNIAGSDYSKVIAGDYVSNLWTWLLVARVYIGDRELLDRTLLHPAPVIILALFALFAGRRKYGIPYFATVAIVFVDLCSTTSVFRPLLQLIPGFEDLSSHRPTAPANMMLFATPMLVGAGVQLLRMQRKNWYSVITRTAPLLFILAVGVYSWSHDLFIGWRPIFLAIVTTGLIVLPLIRSPYLHGVAARVTPTTIALAMLALIIAYPTAYDFANTLRNPQAAPEFTNPIARDEAISDITNLMVRRSDPGTVADLLQSQQASGSYFRYAPYTGTAGPESYAPAALRRNERDVLAILANARATRLGLEQVPGYNAVHLKYYVDYVEAMNGGRQDYHYLDLMTPAVSGSPLLDMLNVRYVLVPAGLDPQPPIAEFWSIAYQDADVIAYENPNVFGRAWIVHDVRPAMDGAELELFDTGQVDGRVTAFVHGDVPAVAAPDPAIPGNVTITSYEPESITTRVLTSAAGLLVFSENYASGWNAYINGEQVDILRTNHTLRGVPVPAGEHEVVLKYEPRELTIGLWSTGLTSIATIGIWTWAAIDKRRTRRGPKLL
jgi:hypothetical protein